MNFERVVLIDDNEIDIFFATISLKKAGFEGEVMSFVYPAEGLAYLLKDQVQVPTCLLLDINMPGINGFDVAQALNEGLRPRSKFELFILTSSSWSEDRRRADTIPLIQGYLVKPMTTSDAAALLSG